MSTIYLSVFLVHTQSASIAEYFPSFQIQKVYIGSMAEQAHHFQGERGKYKFNKQAQKKQKASRIYTRNFGVNVGRSTAKFIFFPFKQLKT